MGFSWRWEAKSIRTVAQRWNSFKDPICLWVYINAESVQSKWKAERGEWGWIWQVSTSICSGARYQRQGWGIGLSTRFLLRAACCCQAAHRALPTFPSSLQSFITCCTMQVVCLGIFPRFWRRKKELYKTTAPKTLCSLLSEENNSDITAAGKGKRDSVIVNS